MNLNRIGLVYSDLTNDEFLGHYPIHNPFTNPGCEPKITKHRETVLTTVHATAVVCTHHEDVSDGVQDHQDDLGLLDGEKVTERLQDATLHHVRDLLHRAARRQVRNRPHSLFLALEVTLLKDEQT